MEFITCEYKISLILSNLEVRTLFSKIMPNFGKPISYVNLQNSAILPKHIHFLIKSS